MLLDTDPYIDFKYKRSINFGWKINIKINFKILAGSCDTCIQIVFEVAAFIILNFWILLLCKKKCVFNKWFYCTVYIKSVKLSTISKYNWGISLVYNKLMSKNTCKTNLLKQNNLWKMTKCCIIFHLL